MELNSAQFYPEGARLSLVNKIAESIDVGRVLNGRVDEDRRRFDYVAYRPLLGSKPFSQVNRAMIREPIGVKKVERFSGSTIRKFLAPARTCFSDDRGPTCPPGDPTVVPHKSNQADKS